MNEKKSILIVEDELPLQKAIKAKLELNNFNTVTARAVDQAINYLNDTNIDVIWLDHYLLGKDDGLDFVTKIKENKKWEKIPIFVVSNTASADKVNSYLRFGVSKYYTKSNFRLDSIIEDINNYLNNIE